MAADTTGNTYITGSFTGKIDLDPGVGIVELAAADSTEDMLVGKYDRNGELTWAKQMKSTGTCLPSAIAIDTFGNVYTTGKFFDTVDFDPGTGVYKLYAPGGGYNDCYISKLDKDGNLVWVKIFDGNVRSRSIIADKQGNTYLTGHFKDNVDFDPGVGVYVLNASSYQPFIVKLNIAGNFAWAKQAKNHTKPDSFLNEGLSITLDKSDNVYIAGNFNGVVDFDPGSAVTLLSSDSLNAYILKLSKEGDFIWAKKVGDRTPSKASCVRTDDLDNIYLAGTFYAKGGVFDSGPGGFIMDESGSDIFIAKLDKAGAFAWEKRIGRKFNDYIKMITLDREQNLYATGTFNDTVDFNPGTGVYTLTASGLGSVFLQKMSPCTPSVAADTFTDNFCATYTFWGTTYTKPGIYTQAISNRDGCDSIVTLKLTTDPIVDMTVTKKGETLEAVAVAKAYQWVECPSNDFVPGATGKSFTPSKSGSYAVIIYVDPCRYTSACTSVKRLGLSETARLTQPMVYPSPTTGLLTISTEEALKSATATIINLNGQTVLSKTGVSGNKFELDLSAQPTGVYFIKVVSEDQVMGMTKIIKE